MSWMNWIETHITLHELDNTREEPANAATHLLGALLSLAACIWTLMVLPSFQSTALALGFIIYVLSMLLLYSASALYHHLPRGNAKRICRVLDHANIYILIAGTYTPILLYINSPVTRMILLLVWAITAAGITFTLIFWGRYGVIHVVLYLLMGWMIVFFWNDIVPFIPEALIFWVIAGGLTYTLGVIFYALKRLPFAHAVWHLFVLGGSACFFIGFLQHLL
ncbi:MAG: hemolysin III family protein [Spirochaetia bacterium]|nr:hemolysin III family protein [Spirochaetia bacterium]MCF7939974.1 hemolysin III family protein [Spirochaetia bacterium]